MEAEIALLTNSLAATDVAAVHSGYARHRPQLIKGGVRLLSCSPMAVRLTYFLWFEGLGPPLKPFVADERLGFIDRSTSIRIRPPSMS
jgi:cardiolipin synthase C